MDGEGEEGKEIVKEERSEEKERKRKRNDEKEKVRGKENK